MPDDVPAVMMPGCPFDVAEHRRQLPQRSRSSCPARGCSSASTTSCAALRVGDGDGRDLVAEASGRDRRAGAPLRLERVRVRRLARDAVLAREHSTVSPMIMPHSEQVKPSRYIASTSVKFPILWPQRASSASIRYGMRLIDSMPPARTTVGLAEHDRLRAGGDRLHARGAGLVDRLRGNAVGKPGATPDLARGIGPGPGLPAVADQHFVDVGWVDARALERRLRGDRAELGGMDVRNDPP